MTTEHVSEVLSGAVRQPEPIQWNTDDVLQLLCAGFGHSATVAPASDAVRAAADLLAQQIAVLRRDDTELIAALRGALVQAAHDIPHNTAAVGERYQQFVDLVRRWIIGAVNSGALTVADANGALRYLTMPPQLRFHFDVTVHTPISVTVEAQSSDDAIAAAETLIRVDLRELRQATVHPSPQWQLRLRTLDDRPLPPDAPVPPTRFLYRVFAVVPLTVEVTGVDQRDALRLGVDAVTADLDHLDVVEGHAGEVRDVDVVPVDRRDYDPAND